MPPNRANDSSGWRGRSFGQQDYLKKCERKLLGTRVPKNPWNKILWEAHFQIERLNDFDNLVARLKWPLDMFVKFGFLKDDSPKHAWPKSIPTQEKAKRTEQVLNFKIEVYD